MKKSSVTTMIAAPLITLSSIAFSAELPKDEPMLLTANQMDSVTAGRYGDTWDPQAFLSRFSRAGFFNFSPITQEVYAPVYAPVTIVQLGNNNTAAVVFSIPSNYSTTSH